MPGSFNIINGDRRALEQATGGKQTIIFDKNDYPSTMNVIPIFRYEELGMTGAMGTGVCSAFDVGTGSPKSEIFIGTYQASMVNNIAVSAAGVAPAANINFDNAKAACSSKGAGWHLMTVHEWAAISLWCEANGFQPRGNTDYGRAHDRTLEFGRRNDGALPTATAGTPVIRTGSGPVEWRHNKQLDGIADLVGNVWEWQEGLKLVGGQLHASLFNMQVESGWVAQGAYLDGASGITLTDAAPTIATTSAVWRDMPKSLGYVSNQLLKKLLVEPAGSTLNGRVYSDISGERICQRGGYSKLGGGSGLAALYLGQLRTATSSDFGFRLAYITP